MMMTERKREIEYMLKNKDGVKLTFKGTSISSVN